ncbi:MAG: hypothetical protein GY712_05770 [Oceanicoccus sp.]|uniref:hypothetical protein n=1 Tax=Oceanicoccus sp. TaxID=2691044 RepID=UPI00262BD3AE|nr:hypothetical protein [Oceanicoccus sp.]MCP3907508.1 hypothetical protein [Oceanicoccus sp.]
MGRFVFGRGFNSCITNRSSTFRQQAGSTGRGKPRRLTKTLCIMRKLLLSLEALILLGPLTLVLCYTLVLTLLIGIPASVMQHLDSSTNYDLFLPLSAVGNIAGVYAIVILWSLVVHTIQGKDYPFIRSFKWGVAAGIIASVCLVIIYGRLAIVFGVLPPIVVAIHFAFLQQARRANA